jgi:hypothetical protein
MCVRLWTSIVLFLAGCSLFCPEPFGNEHVLLFVAPLGGGMEDGAQVEITIPQHYDVSDSTHSCMVWDFDFDNTQIEASGHGSLTVIAAERVPTSDPSSSAGGYRMVVECHLPARADEARDIISVRVVRDGQALYEDEWVQRCRRR